MTLLLAGGKGVDDRLGAAVDRLRDAGVDVGTQLEPGRSTLDALVDAVPDHDATVMGESAPSLGSLVFGKPSERVAPVSVGPVLAVRQDELLHAEP